MKKFITPILVLASLLIATLVALPLQTSAQTDSSGGRESMQFDQPTATSGESVADELQKARDDYDERHKNDGIKRAIAIAVVVVVVGGITYGVYYAVKRKKK